MACCVFYWLKEEHIMCKRLIFLTAFVAVLLFARYASAVGEDWLWTDETGDHLWTTADNWISQDFTEKSVPTADRDIKFSFPPATCPTVAEGMDVVGRKLLGPAHRAFLGHPDPEYTEDQLMTMWDTDPNAVLAIVQPQVWTITGGRASFGYENSNGYSKPCEREYDRGVVNMSGGYLYFHGYVRGSESGECTWNISGGIIEDAAKSGDGWMCHTEDTGFCKINMTGGAILVGLESGNGMSLQDSVDSNCTIDLAAGFIHAGASGYDGGDDPLFQSGTSKIIIGDGAFVCDGNALGEYSAYLDDGWVTAKNGGESVYLRYDAAADVTIYAAAGPDQAYCHYPVDTMFEIASPTTLSWGASDVAQAVDGHDVYFGTDEQAVADANVNTVGIYQGRQTEPNFVTPVLLLNTNYYWRVDEVNDSTIYPGKVVSFKTTKGAAKDPNPVNGEDEAELTLDGTVSWTSGGGWVISHEVYLGTDEQAVTDANKTTAGIYQGSTTNTNFDLGILQLGQTYYWRVDERNTGMGMYSKGDVWSFTLANFYVVDDMESYNDTDNLIYDTWSDYHADGTSQWNSTTTTTGMSILRPSVHTLPIRIGPRPM